MKPLLKQTTHLHSLTQQMLKVTELNVTEALHHRYQHFTVAGCCLTFSSGTFHILATLANQASNARKVCYSIVIAAFFFYSLYLNLVCYIELFIIMKFILRLTFFVFFLFFSWVLWKLFNRDSTWIRWKKCHLI